MTSEELRELADKLVDPSDTLFKFHMDQAAAYLRACADALDAGPVAWAATDETGKVVEALGMNESRRFSDPLYLLAMPASSQRQCGCRACLTPAQRMTTFVVCSECGNKRCPKADDHRNQCTGSNAPAQAQPLRLPEPMTEAEVGAAMKEVERTCEYGHHHFGYWLAVSRAIESETLRRVKEANN